MDLDIAPRPALDTRLLAGVAVPDSPLVSRAIDYARENSQPYLFNHFSILLPGMETHPVADSEANTTSVFANADWKFHEQFTLTGGLRYTQAEMDYVECFASTG